MRDRVPSSFNGVRRSAQPLGVLRTVVALLASLAAIAGAACTAAAQPGSSAWWKGLSAEQQATYLQGFLDFAYYEASPRPKASDFSAYELAEIVRSRLSKYPNDNKTILELVLSMPLPQPRQKLPGGEVYTGPHGYFTGEFWRQSPQEEKIVFLRAYIEASRILGTHPIELNQPVEWYADRMSEWFGTSPTDPGELDSAKAEVPIADALRAVINANPP